MDGFLVFGIVLTWGVLVAGGWLGWQLLRQNSRVRRVEP